MVVMDGQNVGRRFGECMASVGVRREPSTESDGMPFKLQHFCSFMMSHPLKIPAGLWRQILLTGGAI